MSKGGGAEAAENIIVGAKKIGRSGQRAYEGISHGDEESEISARRLGERNVVAACVACKS